MELDKILLQNKWSRDPKEHKIVYSASIPSHLVLMKIRDWSIFFAKKLAGKQEIDLAFNINKCTLDLEYHAEKGILQDGLHPCADKQEAYDRSGGGHQTYGENGKVAIYRHRGRTFLGNLEEVRERDKDESGRCLV